MKKIMIVDDEYLVRVGIRSFLDWEAHGYSVIGEAADGNAALEKIEQLRPDIILTDLKMGPMDGLALIEECRKRYPKIRFVVLSSFYDGDNVKNAMKLGASDYIFKPQMDPKELLRILDQLPTETEEAELRDVVRNNLSAIRQRAMKLLIQKDYPNKSSIYEELQRFGMQIDLEKPYRAILIAPTSRDAYHQTRDDQLMKYMLENMAQEIWQESADCGVASLEGLRLLILVTAQDGEAGKLSGEKEESFERLRSYALRYMGVELRAAVSVAVNGINALSKAWEECRETIAGYPAAKEEHISYYSGALRPEISRICNSVKEFPEREYTIKDAAAACHMSESYFSHVFKRETGLSFVEYVNRFKVERAKELLARHDIRISEVSVRIGIENPNYFSVLFRKITGRTPQEFRSRSRETEGKKQE